MDPTKQNPSEAAERMTILVIEEHPAVRTALRSLLTSEGFSVVAVSEDPFEATELAQSLVPDAILLDWRLRGSPSGIEALRYLRRHVPGVPVVVYTSFPERTFHDARQLGATDVVVKSLSHLDDLTISLRKAIADRRSARARHLSERAATEERAAAVHQRAAEFYLSLGLTDRAELEATMAERAWARSRERRIALP